MPGRLAPLASDVMAIVLPSGAQSVHTSCEPSLTRNTRRACERTHEIHVSVPEVGRFVGHVCWPPAIRTPRTANRGIGIRGELRVVRAIGPHLPYIELPPLVGDHGQPLIVGAEFNHVLLACRVMRQLFNCTRLGINGIEVVLLIALVIFSKDNARIGAIPRKAGPQRAWHFTMADLVHFSRVQIKHIQLHAPCLVPIKRDLIARS